MSLPFAQLEVPQIPTDTFVMSPLELKDFIDFEVKRLYYITAPTGATSQHCHKIEQELFVLQQGTCTAIIDYGEGRVEIPMTGPTSALRVPNWVWHGFKDFSPDAVLMALSSTNYNPTREDYIDDYEYYLSIRDEKLAQNNA